MSQKINICDNCAMRLFNKHHNLQGVGNPVLERCIVVDNVDYGAYKKGNMEFSSQVEVIRHIISSTGELDSVFIVPLIRCNEKITTGLDNASYNNCLHWFANDIRKYHFKDIMLLGNAARRFLQCNITDNLDNLIISKNKIRYCVNYSPLVKYVSEDNFEIFKKYLLQWYYSVQERDYHKYNIIYL